MGLPREVRDRLKTLADGAGQDYGVFITRLLDWYEHTELSFHEYFARKNREERGVKGEGRLSPPEAEVDGDGD